MANELLLGGHLLKVKIKGSEGYETQDGKEAMQKYKGEDENEGKRFFCGRGVREHGESETHSL